MKKVLLTKTFIEILGKILGGFMAIPFITEVLPAVTIAERGFFFQRNVDTVQKAVEKIMTEASRHAQMLSNSVFSGMTLQQIEASRQIGLVLQQLCHDYEQELQLTVDKANEFVQKTLLEVDHAIHKSILDPLSSPTMKGFIDRLQMTASLLPFASQDPYVRAITPTAMVPFDLSKEVVIEVQGNFPLCGERVKNKPVPVPMLTVHEQLFEAHAFHQQIIQFLVPDTALFPEKERLKDRISYTSCTITIPSAEKTREYRASFHLLPESPGKLTLHVKKVIPKKEIRGFSSPIWLQNSRLEKVPIIGRPYTETAPQGWTIIEADDPDDPRAKKPQIVNLWAEGWHEQNIVSVTPSSISCTASTYGRKGHDKTKDVGKVDFRIDYTAFRIEPATVEEKEEVPIRWGAQVMLDEKYADAWAVFQAFDGSESLYDLRQQIRDLFISVTRTGNRSLLSVRPPLTTAPASQAKM